GARLVGAEHLGGGVEQHDDAVRQVGAVVVPDREVEGQQPAVVVEPDGHLVDLPALVGAGDEVFAPVLDPLDLIGDPGLPQLAGGPGDHDLLGPRVHDLHTETAADVGGDAVDLVVRHAKSSCDRGTGGGRGLSGRPEGQRLLVVVPTGVDAFALHRHR